MINTVKNFLIMLQNLQQSHSETAEATSDWIGNKIANKITSVSKNSQQINSETATDEHDREIPKERYISGKERREIIDELELE